jgi:hypothetical protein
MLIFGGWKPYQNLSEITMFDTKKSEMENISKFAL